MEKTSTPLETMAKSVTMDRAEIIDSKDSQKAK